jgi:hypothetical protein
MNQGMQRPPMNSGAQQYPMPPMNQFPQRPPMNQNPQMPTMNQPQQMPPMGQGPRPYQMMQPNPMNQPNQFPQRYPLLYGTQQPQMRYGQQPQMWSQSNDSMNMNRMTCTMPSRFTTPVSGDLSTYPIAMAYVPMQQWSQTYPLSQGFSQGTIFPELDLPFMMGRCVR